MNVTRRRALGALAGALTLTIATRPGRAAETVEVGIDNFVYNPQELKVKAGTTVTWTNRDDIPHTVTSKTGAFRSKALDTDDKFSFTFEKPGSFPYFCALHPHMTGTIVVEADSGKS